MQTPLFIHYANAPLNESPEALTTVIDAIEDEFGAIRAVPDLPSIMESYVPTMQITLPAILNRIVQQIIQFGEDLSLASSTRGRLRTPPHVRRNINCHQNDFFEASGSTAITGGQLAEFSPDLMIDAPTEIAFEATFGHLDDQCRNSEGVSRCGIFHPWTGHFENPGSVPCYRCQQVGFRNALADIADGQEFNQIEGLSELLHLGVSSYRHAITIDEHAHFSNGWKSPLTRENNFLPGPDAEFPFKYVFNNLLMSFIGYSLAKFLSDRKLSRTRLHKCEVCGDFFVDEPRAKRCPPPKDCRKAGKQNYQAEFMRKKRNPESKDFDPKYIK